MADIPAEIRDIIIDYLRDDHRSLKACSLVCHAWLDSSRYHLFYNFLVRPGHHLAFKGVLENTDSPIGRHIQSLCLQTGYGSTTNFSTILDILGMLPRLNHLIFSWHEMEPFQHICNPDICTPNRELKTLQLISLSNHPQNLYLYILAMLHIYGKIDALYLELDPPGRHDFSELLENCPFPNIASPIVIRSLSLALLQKFPSILWPHFYRFIGKYLDTNAFRRVSIQTKDPGAVLGFGEFLRDSGRAIESLTLDLTGVNDRAQQRIGT